MNTHSIQRKPIWGKKFLYGLWRAIFALPFLLLAQSTTLQTAQADEEGHSHFRFGHITWEEAGSNTARITFTAGFRRSGFECWDPLTETVVACSGPDGLPGIGDVVFEWIGGTSINDFGDGASTDILYFKVFAFDAGDDWIMARALEPGSATKKYLTHTYPGAGPYTFSNL
jgi:hypothetical protein